MNIQVVAIKKMNLEANLDEVVHEAQLMKNYNHPNILPLYTSFVNDADLWMVMPFISGGSVLHIIKYAHPEVSIAQQLSASQPHRTASTPAVNCYPTRLNRVCACMLSGLLHRAWKRL